MTNNALLNRLMEKKDPAEEAKLSTQPGEDEESTIRIVTARYKIYIIVIVFLMLSIGSNYYPRIKSNHDAMEAEKQSIETQLSTLRATHLQLETDQTKMQEILTNKETLKNCLNQENNPTACKALPSSRSEEYGTGYFFPTSFLQLHSLWTDRMVVDEKKILRNLNEYLTHTDFQTNSSPTNGKIQSIAIGDPTPMKGKEHFYVVPLTVSIQFTTHDNLLSFVHNVERKLIENETDRIFYQIQNISYDIVKASEPQQTTISMNAYYYHNPFLQETPIDVNTTEEN